MKKVLFIVHNLKFGGVQKITVELARNHVLQGNEVHILCLDKGKSIDIDFDCQIHFIDNAAFLIKRPWLAIYYAIYKSLLRSFFPASEFIFSKPVFKPQILSLLDKLESNRKFDVIFIRSMRSVKRTWWLKRSNVVRSLHMPHNLQVEKKTISNRYNHWLSACLFKNKTFFSVSDYIAAPLVSSFHQHNIFPKKFDVINNPCDIERVKQLSEQKVEVVEGNYILGVGRLSKQKRFDLLIKAFHKAHTKHYKLVILGEGNQRTELEKLINELQLNDSVIMPGFVSNPYPWYKNAKLFVLSSDNEGFVNVITEALACGVPVISTDCGPVHEILKGRLARGITPRGDFIGLSEKINEYLLTPAFPAREDVEWLSFESIISQQMSLVEA